MANRATGSGRPTAGGQVDSGGAALSGLALKQDITAPVPFILGAGQDVQADLTDAVTAASSVILTTTHQSTGTPAVGFGSTVLHRLANALNVMKDAGAWIIRWVTATSGSEDSAMDFQVGRAGGIATALTLNGKTLAGNYPVTVPLRNTDNHAIGLTFNGDQEIVKATGGNLYLRAHDHNGSIAAISTQLYPGIVVTQPVIGVPDVILGANVDPGNTSTQGFIWFPASGTTGAQTGVPAGSVGNYTGHIPAVMNSADSKMWARFGGTWKSQMFVATPQTLGASLTNNVTVGGTTNTIDNIVAATDPTAAELVTTRNAIYQLALKVSNLELALKKNGSMAIT